jgi:hypothetical protein
MLELIATQSASGSPGTSGGFASPVAYASSAAFGRDEDAATLSAVALLMAIAHPAAGVVPPEQPRCRRTSLPDARAWL